MKALFHQLKGSAGNAGIPKLQALSLAAEQYVLEGAWPQVEKILEEIQAFFKQLKSEVEKVFSPLSKK